MQNFKFAISSIMGHKMRSFLTMLGIIIGVMSVVVVVALGAGMGKAFEDLLGNDRQNVQLFYSPKASKNGSGIITAQELQEEATNGDVDDSQTVTETPVLQESWLQEIVNTNPGIDGYYATNNASGTVTYNKTKVDNIPITGINATYFANKKYEIVAGRELFSADYQQYARVVLLDTKLAERLFASADNALNKIIEIGENRYRVIGVYKDPDETRNRVLSLTDGNLLMTNTQVAAEYGVPEIGNAVVHVKDLDKVLEDGSAAARQLTKLSGIHNGEYQIIDMASQLAQVQSQVLVVQIVFGSIAGIALLVGGIGVMNIMLVSVTERTREIGLRKALGATRRNILSQFMIESMVLTSIGGLIGLGLAYVIVSAIGHSLDALFGGPPTVSLGAGIGAIVFSATIGILFGILPANKASKLDPIEALRYE